MNSIFALAYKKMLAILTFSKETET